jgi:outer membrane biosynthesis protein TonB
MVTLKSAAAPKPKPVPKPASKPAPKKPGGSPKAKASARQPVASLPKAAKSAKAIKPAKPARAGKTAGAAKPKTKLVRDSFTFPKTEYAVLDALKSRGMSLAREVKKSELVRAGIGALNAMGDKDFLAALNAIPSLKTGRPKHARPGGDKGAQAAST